MKGIYNSEIKFNFLIYPFITYIVKPYGHGCRVVCAYNTYIRSYFYTLSSFAAAKSHEKTKAPGDLL